MTGASLKLAFEEIIDGTECYVTQGSYKKPIGGVIKDVLMVFESGKHRGLLWT